MRNFEWSEKDGFWVPKNLSNHHGNSTLRKRLISRGLIREKSPEEISREEQWAACQMEHKKGVQASRKQGDALVDDTERGNHERAKTKKTRRNMVRKRPVRTVRPPRHKIRT